MNLAASIAEVLPFSCEQVLETMFFTGVLAAEERCLGAECASETCKVAATVAFDGPPEGSLSIRLETATAAALASSFLGLDPDAVTEGDCRQVAGELANMICGSVLSRIAPESTLHLATPVVEDGSEIPGGEGTAGYPTAARVYFTLPEGGLEVCMGAVS